MSPLNESRPRPHTRWPFVSLAGVLAFIATSGWGWAGAPARRLSLVAETVAPNAGVLVRGRTSGYDLDVRAKAGPMKIAVEATRWIDDAAFGHNNPHLWLVTPQSGTWPAGERVTLITETSGALHVDVGEKKDETPPSTGAWSTPIPGVLGGPDRPYYDAPDTPLLRIAHPAIVEADSALLRVEVLYGNRTGTVAVGLRTYMYPNLKGDLAIPHGRQDKPVRCVVYDTAGNETVVNLPR
jgi:hypothetical protein